MAASSLRGIEPVDLFPARMAVSQVVAPRVIDLEFLERLVLLAVRAALAPGRTQAGARYDELIKARLTERLPPGVLWDVESAPLAAISACLSHGITLGYPYGRTSRIHGQNGPLLL